MNTNPRRRADPDFDPEPWASALIDYCYFGGPAPPLSVTKEPLEPSCTYAPSKPPPKPRKAPKAKAAPSPPPPLAPKRKPRPRRQRPPSPPPRKLSDFDAAFARMAATQAVIDSILSARSQPARVPEPFRVLGAPYPCTAGQLRAHWRRAIFANHPDRGGDVTNFIRLKNAYEQAKQIQEGRPVTILRYPG